MAVIFIFVFKLSCCRRFLCFAIASVLVVCNRTVRSTAYIPAFSLKLRCLLYRETPVGSQSSGRFQTVALGIGGPRFTKQSPALGATPDDFLETVFLQKQTQRGHIYNLVYFFPGFHRSPNNINKNCVPQDHLLNGEAHEEATASNKRFSAQFLEKGDHINSRSLRFYRLDSWRVNPSAPRIFRTAGQWKSGTLNSS